jgi:DnaK suppressor protein
MDQQAIEQQLRAKLADLQRRLELVSTDMTQAHSADFEEQAQERENDEVIDVIGTETEKSIAQIEAALEKLAHGSYGICSQCGATVDAKRLESIPEATSCVHCAQRSVL